MVLIEQITAPEVGLIYTTNNIQLKIGAKVVGKGILYISQSALAWQPDSLPEGISIQWKQISVHGVSSNPSKCIYFMLDHALVWRGVYEATAARAVAVPVAANGNGAGGDAAGAIAMPMEQQAARGDGGGQDGEEDEGNATDEEDDQDEEEQITECWLMPDDPNTVDTMFQAMTECQAMHPDSADSISEESDFMDDDGGEDDDDAIGMLGREGDGQEEQGHAANGDAAGDAGEGAGGAADAVQGVQNLSLNDNRFADADE